MRLHEKIGLYGLVLPLAGLMLFDLARSLIGSSAGTTPVRTDVVDSRGLVYLSDPVCSCGVALTPELRGPRYWEATCPVCSARWNWGFDLNRTLAALALREAARAGEPSVGTREVPSLPSPVTSKQHRVRSGESTSRITRIPVTSSALQSVGFEEVSSTLEVEFVSGAVYRYFDVPRSVHAGLLAAPSKGRYFNAHVKDAGFAYERVR